MHRRYCRIWPEIIACQIGGDFLSLQLSGLPAAAARPCDILDESVFAFILGRNLVNFKCSGISNYIHHLFGMPCSPHSVHTGVGYCLFEHGLPEPLPDKRIAPHFLFVFMYRLWSRMVVRVNMDTLKVISVQRREDEKEWQVKLTDLNSEDAFWIDASLQKNTDFYSGIVTASSNQNLVNMIIVIRAEQEDYEIDRWVEGDQIQWLNTIPCDKQIIIK